MCVIKIKTRRSSIFSPNENLLHVCMCFYKAWLGPWPPSWIDTWFCQNGLFFKPIQLNKSILTMSPIWQTRMTFMALISLYRASSIYVCFWREAGGMATAMTLIWMDGIWAGFIVALLMVSIGILGPVTIILCARLWWKCGHKLMVP